jgi:crossover junction endodeoxyribonuclease RuvC
MRIVGLDLSLTNTGVAIIEQRPDVLAVDLHSVSSKGSQSDNLTERHNRLDGLRDRIMGYVGAADLAVIEQPAFSRTTGSQHDRSGLWWLVMDALHLWGDEGPAVVEVTPGGLKKYATGSGSAGKDEVLLAVARRYPDIDVRTNDQADALVLAAMGARHLGHPIDDMPKAHLAAMDAVRWPVIA